MRKYLSVIVFLCVIFGFTIGSAVVPSKKFSEMEKRNLQQKPKVSVSSVVKGSYQKKYEKYLSDQFFLRDKWVNIYAQLEKNTGKKEINNVYIGKDDYLIEKYSERDFDDELQKMNVKNLALFLDACSEELGKSNVTCMFVPSKIDVLRNKLSVLEEDYDGSKIVERVRSKVKNKDKVVNLADVLKKRSNEYIYYRSDHHWTTFGAYYAYQEYEKLNGRTAPALKEYKQKVVFDDFLGTTYSKSHVPVKKDEVTTFSRGDEKVSINGNNGEFTSNSFYFEDVAKKSSDRYQLFFSKNTGKIEVTTSAKNNKVLLVLKDSYANSFIPFLSNEYSKIIMIDCRYTKMKMKQIFRQYPEITNVLVMYNIEKFRKDTHISSLQMSLEELKAARTKTNDKDKKDKDSEEDIFSGLVSLD